MELTVQEHRLHICSIARENASILSHPILKLILARSSFKCKYFCLTVTPDDITLVLDEDGYKELPEDVTVSSQCSLWVAMHATCEASEGGPCMNKLTKYVILPLADSEISVFNISTFQDDFILIKESDLEKAVACLSRSNQVTVIRRGEQLSSSDQSKQKETQDELFSQSPRPIKHPFQSPSNRFLITSMHLKDLRHVTAPIMELILFPESIHSSSKEDKIYFFSFSIIHDQISLVLDEEAYTRFLRYI
ncbi:cytosolic arginine sensor for mTORC1 subunit 2-like [Anneissia japonica]|uniref:cytosolic arginine sensor for mTORC1 subunit 2-like n=1 Tax=Anneissia japonica TaxID=1529436 RepID=UPI001425BB15|nr:cytosolic arginine sensor for mTORC1 subunit 2-like [Anneissia japonica]